MSAQPEALNFGTGPSKKTGHYEKFMEVMDPRQDSFTWRKTAIACTAELIGTFLFVFYCAATVVGAANDNDNSNTLIPAFGQGFSLALAIYVCAPASGGHLNPAVTIGVLVVGRINFFRALCYIIAQYIGAICGAGLVRAIIRTEFEGNLGATTVSGNISITGAFFLEFIMTFFLVFVMFSTAIDPRGVGKLAPLAIGLVVVIDVLIGIEWTGASMNPARTLGPQLMANAWDHYWLYFTAPVSGGIVASVAYVLYLKIDPVNDAVDQNNNIIKRRQAIHNVDQAPPEYRPGYRRRHHHHRHSRRSSYNNAILPPKTNLPTKPELPNPIPNPDPLVNQSSLGQAPRSEAPASVTGPIARPTATSGSPGPSPVAVPSNPDNKAMNFSGAEGEELMSPTPNDSYSSGCSSGCSSASNSPSTSRRGSPQPVVRETIDQSLKHPVS